MAVFMHEAGEIEDIPLSVEDAYMVTNNKKHFPSKPHVVTPSEMLIILGEMGVMGSQSSIF